MRFLINEAWLNMRRSPGRLAACLVTVVGTMFILGLCSLIAWHTSNLAAAAPRRLEVHVFTKQEATPAQTAALATKVRAMQGVALVKIVSRERAWADMKRSYPQKDDLAGLQENPLPDKLEITTARPELTFGVAQALRSEPLVARVNDAAEELRSLLTIANFFRWGGIGLALLLAIVTACTISNVIRLTVLARHLDIKIMQDVGATAGTIRGPFVIEGLAAGAIGGLVAGLLAGLVLQYLRQQVLPGVPFINEFRVDANFPAVVLGLAAAGALFGTVGSLVSIQRHVRTSA